MKTTHTVHNRDARDLSFLPDASIHLIVTSPPYPMIAMWDQTFCDADPDIGQRLESGDGEGAFDLMHAVLDVVWRECFRVLEDGCFACINIGDATRTIGGRFRLFSNHTRIISSCRDIGFDCLPMIHWWKPTNAPNKFMGSGMLPAGAYVTLEHEYILVFRKGSRREFTGANKTRRSQSALFWEERNCWYSDTWDLSGIRQDLETGAARTRSAAFPLELAYRLISMYSIKGDSVLDPFLGTGTTTLAAIAAARNSLGVEKESTLVEAALAQSASSVPRLNRRIQNRIGEHEEFVRARLAKGKIVRYLTQAGSLPVVTRQETAISLETISSIVGTTDNCLIVQYDPM